MPRSPCGTAPVVAYFVIVDARLKRLYPESPKLMDSLIRLSLKDMLFINYGVDPQRLRPFVPGELALDTFIDGEGREIAFMSAVAFRVEGVRSGLLPVPGLSFDQVNLRAYVRSSQGSAVYFFAMKINSRLVAGTSDLLRMPVSYEQVEIITAPASAGSLTGEARLAEGDPAPHRLHYSLASPGPHGIEASARIGGSQSSAGPATQAVPAEFFTERPVGYATVAHDSLYEITADHERLVVLGARVESVHAPMISSLGIINLDETANPHSVLYVREAVFKTRIPRPIPQ